MLPQLQTHQMDIHLFDFSPAICMSSMCVQLFKFEEATGFKVILGECPKIKDGHHFHGNEAREKKLFCFFLHIFSY